MPEQQESMVAGIDVGTECVKVVILDTQGLVHGRAIVPTRGYFQDCVHEAMSAALDEAQTAASAVIAICATGYGASSATIATTVKTEMACHVRGVSSKVDGAKTIIVLGGREPKVIKINAEGQPISSRSVRKCAVGIGTFLMFAARHLDVHPTRLMDLALQAGKPASIGSYCSVFAEVEVIDLLLQGVQAGEIALGCMYSVAERILEIGHLDAPVWVTGGICEYFPGVVSALAVLSGKTVQVVPEPLLSAAVGAGLFALDTLQP